MRKKMETNDLITSLNVLNDVDLTVTVKNVGMFPTSGAEISGDVSSFLMSYACKNTLCVLAKEAVDELLVDNSDRVIRRIKRRIKDILKDDRDNIDNRMSLLKSKLESIDLE
jgi:hypothetical protein